MPDLGRVGDRICISMSYTYKYKKKVYIYTHTASQLEVSAPDLVWDGMVFVLPCSAKGAGWKIALLTPEDAVQAERRMLPGKGCS